MIISSNKKDMITEEDDEDDNEELIIASTLQLVLAAKTRKLQFTSSPVISHHVSLSLLSSPDDLSSYSRASVPFSWEEEPGKPKHQHVLQAPPYSKSLHLICLQGCSFLLNLPKCRWLQIIVSPGSTGGSGGRKIELMMMWSESVALSSHRNTEMIRRSQEVEVVSIVYLTSLGVTSSKYGIIRR